MSLFGWRLEYVPEVSTVQIEGRISIFEILSLIGFLIAIVSLVIAVRAAQQQSRTRRAEFSFRIWEAFMQDEVQKAYLEIEWGRFVYPDKATGGFLNDEQERAVDRLLYLLDEMALLIESGVLSKADKERWSYQGGRVFRDRSVKNYLTFLDDFFSQNGMRRRPHDAARRVFGGDKHVRAFKQIGSALVDA